MSKKIRNKILKTVLLFFCFIVLIAAGILIFSDFRDEESDRQSLDAFDNASKTNKEFNPGERFVTYVETTGVGKVAVQVTLPERSRYDDGAPIIIMTPTFFTMGQPSFDEDEALVQQGFVSISFLLPGRETKDSIASQGEDDYGGPNSLAAFADVISFASNQKPDFSGRLLKEMTTLSMFDDNVGLFAFSHPGILATNVLARYGQELTSVAYLVGRENPTEPALSAVEVGHFVGKTAMFNPVYSPAENYSSDGLLLDYSAVQYDTERFFPYFDLDGNGRPGKENDYLFGEAAPNMFGQRFYSPELLNALRKNLAFSESNWPGDLATPEEARAVWSERETLNSYDELAALSGRLRVILVFGERDHVQPAPDKPHIHEAYDGFSLAGLWVRLNPDASYVAVLDDRLARQYEEHPANQEPVDWNEVEEWGHPDIKGAGKIVGYAAVIEMADRTYYDAWAEKFDDLNTELSLP